jgi:predicted dienelactone hydrolase
MIRMFRAVVLAFAVTAAGITPASAQVGVGHRVERLVVPGSAQNESRKVKVHLWYPADPVAYAAADKTSYTSALSGKPLVPDRWDPLSWKVDAEIARETTAVAPQFGRLPVIVFSHGSVNDPIDYAWTLEEIARAGFVVAAPYHVNNTQDDVRIDYINAQAGTPLFACEDGRPGPCSRTDNPRSIQDRVRDISAILDALPGWFPGRVDVARAGVMGHSRGTVSVLAAAGGPSASGGSYQPEKRVRAVMGMAIGLQPLINLVNLGNVTVPTLLVAGGKDRNSLQSLSEGALAAIASVDKRFVAIPNATHRSFDSTYCAQLASAARIAQANPRAILDAYSVPLIASSAPGLVSGKAVHYCAASTFTAPPDITELIRATPNSEYPPAVGDVCSTTSIPCTGLDTEAVKEQMVALAVEFFAAKLAGAASGDVSGTVPATLSLTLTGPATFGAFTPGLARDYLATTTATVISTAGDATLSVADPDTVATGRLVNGAFALPQLLQARANSGDYAPVGGSSSPTALLTYTGPVSNDKPTIGFKQPIGASDALRTGTYAKSLTFTLSTTAP